VIRRADDHGVDVPPVEHPPEVARLQIGRLVEVGQDPRRRFRGLLVVHVAERDDLRAEPQRVPEVARALPAAADQRDPDASGCAGDAVLGGRGLRCGGGEHAACGSGRGVLEKVASTSLHGTSERADDSTFSRAIPPEGGRHGIEEAPRPEIRSTCGIAPDLARFGSCSTADRTRMDHPFDRRATIA
jgi:hypothetical protein